MLQRGAELYATAKAQAHFPNREMVKTLHTNETVST